MPRWLVLALTFAASASCRMAKSSRGDEQVDSLLGSSDARAVYDAGVDRYRDKDYATARRLWRRAAQLGDREAASNVGYLLYYGLGGAPDSLEAGRFWRAAVARGDAEANRHMAQAIWDGDHRLGSDVDGYAHALAAEHLARHTPQMTAEEIAKDADALMSRYQRKLSSDERVAAQRQLQDFVRVVADSP